MEGVTWFRYMKQRGTLNISRKLEQTVGLLTALYVSANSKNTVDFSDYMPFERASKKEISQEDMFAQVIAGEYK